MKPKPPSPTQRLRQLRVDEISLVPEGDNPPAKIALFKRRGGPMSLVQKLLALVGQGATDAEVEKRLYDEVNAQKRAQTIANTLLGKVSVFAESVQEVLSEMTDEEERTKAIKESMRQFVEDMDGELPEALEEKMSKALASVSKTTPTADVEKAITEVLKAAGGTATTAPPRRPTDKEPTMDLSKLSPEDRAAVEAALATTKALDGKSPTALLSELAKAQEKIATLEGTSGGSGGSKPELSDLEKAIAKLPEALRSTLQKDVAKDAANRLAMQKRLDALEEESNRASFSKTVPALKGLPITHEDLVAKLWAIKDEAVRADTLKVLQAASKAAEMGSAFRSLGSGRPDGAGSAYGRIQSRAKEIQKADPTLTLEAARVMAMRENPELYAEYEEEASAH